MSGQDGGRRQVGRVGVEATKAAERVPEALSVVVWLYSRWHHLLDPALLNGLGSVMCRWTSPSLLLTRWRPREPYTSLSGAVQCWLEGVEGRACQCKIVRSECLSDAVWRRCAVGEAGSWGLEECVIACILVSVIVCILIIVKRLVDHQYGGAGRRLVGR